MIDARGMSGAVAVGCRASKQVPCTYSQQCCIPHLGIIPKSTARPVSSNRIEYGSRDR
jgi:hypothetical protein